MLANIRKDWKRNYTYYLILLPVILYYIVFMYIPMGGLAIAFQRFTPAKGLFGSTWVGFQNFVNFFSSYYFGRLIANTIILSLLGLVLGTIFPVVFSLLLNEVKHRFYKKSVQTLTYIPYFISIVVVASMIRIFVAPQGPVGAIISAISNNPTNILSDPAYFRVIMVVSDIWQMLGYSSVIYLAALSTIDSSLYEAAVIDGANRWKQTVHITLPGIMPTVVVILVMRTGQLLNVGFEKILLIYSPSIYSTADVISTFVYRKGLMEADYSFATAIGLFNSIAGLAMILISNQMAKKTTETSLF